MFKIVPVVTVQRLWKQLLVASGCGGPRLTLVFALLSFPVDALFGVLWVWVGRGDSA